MITEVFQIHGICVSCVEVACRYKGEIHRIRAKDIDRLDAGRTREICFECSDMAPRSLLMMAARTPAARRGALPGDRVNLKRRI